MSAVRSARRAAAFAAVLALAAGTACSHFVILNDPLSAEEHSDLGVAYESAGKLDLAKREYRKALRLKPDFVPARINLGNIEAARERWSAAEREYRRALRVSPDDPDALNNLAWVLYRQDRRLDEAERLARQALEASEGRDTTYVRTLEAIMKAKDRPR